MTTRYARPSDERPSESMLPLQLRRRSWIVKTNEIKLDKNVMTSTIEIEKFDIDPTLNGKSGGNKRGDLSDFFDGEDEEQALSESDLSHVVKRADLERNPIEFFSGDDPIFNLANLGMRIKQLTKPQVYKLTAIIIAVILCYVGIYLWFDIKLDEAYD